MPDTTLDIFSKNWFTILIDATMHRIEKVDPGESDTIVVRKVVFDELVKIAEIAARINSRLPVSGKTQKPWKYDITTENGIYTTSVELPGYVKAVATGRTLLESITKALSEYSLPYTFFLLNGDMELNKNRQIFVNKML